MNILTYFPREVCYGQLGKMSSLCVWWHLEHSIYSDQEVWRGLGSMWWHLEHSIATGRCGEGLGVCGGT